jgi:hypothetical protein
MVQLRGETSLLDEHGSHSSVVGVFWAQLFHDYELPKPACARAHRQPNAGHTPAPKLEQTM